jgi:pimeloyl-ACP methyl ester carboxylesterase
MEALPQEWDLHSLAWPGLGDEPLDPSVCGLDDLVALVTDHSGSEPVDLVAQSMGCLVALKVALRAPDKVRKLVLTGTSGGIPSALLESASDWRPHYREEFPRAPSWITEIREDLSTQLHTIAAPTLLLWGTKDAISPVSVGRALKRLLPNAELSIIEGGDHDCPQTHSDQAAAAILDHLS